LWLVCVSISKTDTNLAWESASRFHREADFFSGKTSFRRRRIIMPALATYLFSAKGAVFILAWGNAPGINAIPIPALKARFIPMP
jgi:hypothetical protein